MSNGAIDTHQPSTVLPGVTAVAEGVRRLRAALDARVAPLHGRSLARIVQRIHPIDPYGWLAAQARGARSLWHDRASGATRAGVGVAHRIDASDIAHAIECGRALVGSSGAFLLVTARFDVASTVSSEWRAFGRARALVPAIELSRHDGGAALAVAVDARTGAGVADARKALESIRPALASPAPPARAAGGELAVLDAAPPPADWIAGTKRLLTALGGGGLEKAVLARVLDVRLAGEGDGAALAHALALASTDAYIYLVEAGETAFAGATPELLYHRKGTRITSEAIAGTRPRGPTPEADDALAASLRSSEKERREHALVADHIASILGPRVVGELEVGPLEVRRLAAVQHLAARISGHPRPGATDGETIAALHPTPAVCGQPRERARRMLRAIETFDRGLYAGPIGVLEEDGATLAVALRGALVRGRVARLFAGAGVVAGSDPHEEWSETGAKLRAVASVLEPDAPDARRPETKP